MLGICRDGKSDSKDGAVAERALRFDQTAMQVHDPTRNRETQAGAAGFAGASLIGAVEPLENMGQVFVADANSAITNLDSGVSRPIGKIQFNLAAMGRVLDGVFDDNQEKTLDRGRVSGNPHGTSCKFACDLDSLARREYTGFLGNLLQMWNEIDVAKAKISGPGI